MAFPGSMRVILANGREIVGGPQLGRIEGTIFVHAVRHEVRRDARGTLQHGELTVVKDVDAATPDLLRVHHRAERLRQVTLYFYAPNPSTGRSEVSLRIELGDARIAGARAELLDGQIEENRLQRPREHITFRYDSIIWTWVPTSDSVQV